MILCRSYFINAVWNHSSKFSILSNFFKIHASYPLYLSSVASMLRGVRYTLQILIKNHSNRKVNGSYLELTNFLRADGINIKTVWQSLAAQLGLT